MTKLIDFNPLRKCKENLEKYKIKIKMSTTCCDALLLKQRKIGISDRGYPVIMGVPEAKVSPLPPVISSRYFDFINRLNALAEPCVPRPETLCIFVAVANVCHPCEKFRRVDIFNDR